MRALSSALRDLCVDACLGVASPRRYSSFAHDLWYQSGLEFKCTSCGACCQKPLQQHVQVSEADQAAIAQHLSLDVDQFKTTFLRPGTDRLRTRDNGACVFLHSNRCTVHAVKPTQCATYPFWPSALSSKIDWMANAKDCEGIVVPPFRHAASEAPSQPQTREMSSDTHSFGMQGAAMQPQDSAHNPASHQAPLDVEKFQRHHAGSVDADKHVSAEQIIKAEMMYFIQLQSPPNIAAPRGDLEQILEEATDSATLEQSASIITEGQRRMVYESERLAVVDTRDDVGWFRDLVVKSSPHFTMSKVRLHQDASSGQQSASSDAAALPQQRDASSERAVVPDLSKLPDDPPVFQTLAAAAPLCLRLRQQAGHPASPLRVAMIGAGACAIPAVLAHTHPDSIAVDAVDLDAEVLNLGKLFFGAGALPNLRLHHADGIAFLDSAADGHYDVIILDVSEPLAAHLQGEHLHPEYHGAYEQQGPPEAFLQADFVNGILMRKLAERSVVAVNALGPPAHLERVHDMLPSEASRGVQLPGQRVVFYAKLPEGERIDPHSLAFVLPHAGEYKSLVRADM